MTRKQRKVVTEELFKLAVSMVQSGKNSMKDVATALDINKKTLTKIVQQYENGLIFKTAAGKLSETCRQRNFTFSEVDQTIYNSISTNNSIIQKEIQNKVNNEIGLHISQSSISRKIKKLNFSRKRLVLVPQERNTVEKLDLRAIYSVEISRMADENLIFIDETGFNQHTRRSYGYSQINTKAYINVPANKNINRSLICVIGINGVIGFKCKTGAYNSDTFIEFLREIIIPYFSNNRNKVLIMDNARIHKSVQVIQLLESNNIAYKFLVAYSPELNPIEEFFSMLKARFSSLRIECPDITIEDCLSKLLCRENDYNLECIGFYKNMRVWLEKARRREEFI